MGKYDDRAYEVGKGKPPKSTRFKPGQSGNPRGPRRKAKAQHASMNEMLAEILNEMVEVTINDRVVKMPKKQLILLGIVHDGANTTPAQRLKVFNALMKLGAFDLSPSDRRADTKSRNEAIKKFIEVLAAEADREQEAQKLINPWNPPG